MLRNFLILVLLLVPFSAAIARDGDRRPSNPPPAEEPDPDLATLAATPVPPAATTDPSPSKVVPTKTFYISSVDPVTDTVYPWPIGDPAKHKFNLATLQKGAKVLAADGKFKSMVLIHDMGTGPEQIFSSYMNGAKATDAYPIHSGSKSVGEALLAMCEQDYPGFANTPISQILPSSYTYGSSKAKAITPNNLATLTSGWDFTDNSTEIQKSWTNSDFLQKMLSLPMAGTPGKDWRYSTGDYYVLGCAIAYKTNMRLRDYAHQQLFGPLGIDPPAWGQDPQGRDIIGCDFYWNPTKYARFGQLYCDAVNGQAENFIPKAWATVSITTTKTNNNEGYARGFWSYMTVGGDKIFFCWGYRNQMCYVNWKKKWILVVTRDSSSGKDNDDLKDKLLTPYIAGAAIK